MWLNAMASEYVIAFGSLSFYVSVGTRCVYKACNRRPIAKKEAIRVNNVNFTWPNGRCGLEGINLSIKEGELAMIVGPNGCGKSTLLRVVHGFILPDSGDVKLVKPCSYVRQDPDLQIVMPTIGSNIALSIPDGKHMPRDKIRALVLESLESVGLFPAHDFIDKTSYRMSGGQRQRSVLAAALVNTPKSILFDEVTANIDPFNKAELLMHVRRLVTERRIAALWYVPCLSLD